VALFSSSSQFCSGHQSHCHRIFNNAILAHYVTQWSSKHIHVGVLYIFLEYLSKLRVFWEIMDHLEESVLQVSVSAFVSFLRSLLLFSGLKMILSLSLAFPRWELLWARGSGRHRCLLTGDGIGR
jgi:hypothetical protein